MRDDFFITEIKRVIMVGKEEYKEAKTSFPTICKTNELMFHFSGKSTVQFNGKIMETEENTIRFLPQGETSEYTVFRKERGECIDVFFNTNVPISPEAFTIKCTQSALVGTLFKRLFSIWISKAPGYHFECISLLYRIFAELQKQNYIPENKYPALKPALAYIENHFLDPKISVDDLASSCQVSYSYLKQLFVKKYNLSPTKYIIQMKINYACDLLLSERYTIAQIAEICGYSDTHFFSRQFKKYIGISPSLFKEKYKSSK